MNLDPTDPTPQQFTRAETVYFESIPNRPDEFLKFWQKRLTKVRKQGGTDIVITAHSEWETTAVEFNIAYKMMETVEEAKARVAAVAARKEREKAKVHDSLLELERQIEKLRELYELTEVDSSD